MRQIKKQNLKSQVREELEQYIHSMDLNVSNKLPREEELCTTLGVSRVTLRSVLDDMAAAGSIIRIHGKGTFVNPHFREITCRFEQGMHFADLIRNSGYTPRMETVYIKTQEAKKEVADALKINPEDQVLLWLKIFYADEHVCAIVYDYVPIELIPPEAMEKVEKYQDGVFYFLEDEAGIRVSWDKVEIDTILSDDILPHSQGMPKLPERKPFLLLRSVNYDESNQECLYTREYINTSILKYSQIRKRIF